MDYSNYDTQTLKEMEKTAYAAYYKAATRPCGDWHPGKTFPELEKATAEWEAITEELNRRRTGEAARFKQYIEIGGKKFTPEEVGRALGLTPENGESFQLSLCQDTPSGVIRALCIDFGGDHPGIDMEFQAGEEKDSAPILVSRTEQSPDADGAVRTFGYGRDGDYFMFFDADIRSGKEVEAHAIAPSITISGNPGMSVDVEAENPYVKFHEFTHQHQQELSALMDKEFLREQVIQNREAVSEQIYLLTENGYINSDQQVYADLHLDEITEKYLLRCDAWEHEHEDELPLSQEMEFMHEEIRKVAQRAPKDLEAEQPLHETQLFRDAVAHFNQKTGNDIENDFVRQHAAELIFCYENHKDLIDFDFWTHYESLLSDRLSWDEYTSLDRMYGDDPLEIQQNDLTTIASLKATLSDLRDKPQPFEALLNEAKEKAGQSAAQQQTPPEYTH